MPKLLCRDVLKNVCRIVPVDVPFALVEVVAVRPRTKLSEWIEKYIEGKVKKQYRVLAEEKSEVEVSS